MVGHKSNRLHLHLLHRGSHLLVSQHYQTLQTIQPSSIVTLLNKDWMATRTLWKLLNRMVLRRLLNPGFSLKLQPFKRERRMVARQLPKNPRWHYLANQRKLLFIPRQRLNPLRRRRSSANLLVRMPSFSWRKLKYQEMTQLKTPINLTLPQRDLFKKSPKRAVGLKGKRPRRVQARKRRRHPSEINSYF